MNRGRIMEFGIILAKLRIEKGISQKDLAAILEVSQGVISMWETHKRLPDFITIKKIAQYFGVSTDYLFGLTGTSSQSPIFDETHQKVLNYYERLNIENKDYILGEMIKLHRDQEEQSHKKKDIG